MHPSANKLSDKPDKIPPIPKQLLSNYTAQFSVKENQNKFIVVSNSPKSNIVANGRLG